jgi:hypothetical protein
LCLLLNTFLIYVDYQTKKPFVSIIYKINLAPGAAQGIEAEIPQTRRKVVPGTVSRHPAAGRGIGAESPVSGPAPHGDGPEMRPKTGDSTFHCMNKGSRR